jgi:hypothetical protein
VTWRVRIDVEDDADNSGRRDKWRTFRNIAAAVVLLSLWLLVVTALAARLAAQL